jgi:hypothetical protein
MGTEGALLDDATVFAKKTGFVGTGDHTIAATDALGVVDDHDSILALVRSACGADANAGGVQAVMALFGLEGGQEFGPATAMLFVDPIPGMTERDLVFGAAGHYTGFAVHALLGVHYQGVAFRHAFLPRL